MARPTRKQVDDLRSPEGVRSAARKEDRFFLSRAPRILDFDRVDFSRIGNQLGRAVGGIGVENAKSEVRDGEALVNKMVAEAEAGTTDLQKKFARAVADGTISEEESPYFLIGLRKAAARSFASQWYAEASAAVNANGELQATIAPDSSVPNGGEESDGIIDNTFQAAMQRAKEANPALFDDPYFTRQMEKAHASMVPQLQAIAARKRAEAAKVNHRNLLGSELSGRFDLLETDVLGEEQFEAFVTDTQKWITENLHGSSVEKPAQLVWSRIATAVSDIHGRHGASAAQEALTNLRGLKVGKVAIEDDQNFSEAVELLERRLEKAEEDEVFTEARVAAAAEDKAVREFRQGDEFSALMTVARNQGRTAAQQRVTTWWNAQQAAGAGAHDAAILAEMDRVVDSVSDESATSEGDRAKFDAVVDAVMAGNFDLASETVATITDPKLKVDAFTFTDRYRDDAKAELERIPAYAQVKELPKFIAENLRVGHSRNADELSAEFRQRVRQFGEKWMTAAANGEDTTALAGEARELIEGIKADVENLSKPYDTLISDIRARHRERKSAASLIEESTGIDQAEKDRLLDLDSKSAAARDAAFERRANSPAFTSFLGSELLSLGELALGAGLTEQTFITSPDPTALDKIPGPPRLTPEGQQVLLEVQAELLPKMAEWAEAAPTFHTPAARTLALTTFMRGEAEGMLRARLSAPDAEPEPDAAPEPEPEVDLPEGVSAAVHTATRRAATAAAPGYFAAYLSELGDTAAPRRKGGRAWEGWTRHGSTFSDPGFQRQLLDSLGDVSVLREAKLQDGSLMFPASDTLDRHVVIKDATFWSDRRVAPHPHLLVAQLLKKSANQAPDRGEWLEFTEEMTGRALANIFENPQWKVGGPEKARAILSARKFLGVDHRDLLAGVLRPETGSKHTVAVSEVGYGAIEWEVTPLMFTEDQLSEASFNDELLSQDNPVAQVARFFGVSTNQEFERFVAAQSAAHARIR